MQWVINVVLPLQLGGFAAEPPHGGCSWRCAWLRDEPPVLIQTKKTAVSEQSDVAP